MSEQELKACPCCNKPASEGEFSDGVNIRYYTSCDDEECIGWELWNAQYMTREQARTAWNRRASPWRTDWENAPKDGSQVYVWGAAVASSVERAEIVHWSRHMDRWVDPGGFHFEPVAFQLVTPPLPERQNDD